MEHSEAAQSSEISSSSAPSSALSPKSEEKGFPQLFMRQYDYDSLKAWIKKMEDEREEMDGIKELPPLEIIEFEDLMAEAWSPARLLPWTCGIVHFRDYIAYLKKFFNSNVALHFDLHAAAKLCLKMKKNYMENGNIHQGNLSLEIQKVAENIMKERTSEGQFAVAAAGLVGIAAEAKLMSKLSKTDTKMCKFSNNIRLCALHLMTYNGPESDAIAGAMLGMSQEAKKVHKYLHTKDDKAFAKLQICFTVRKSMLRLLGHLEHLFVSRDTVNSAEAAAEDDKDKGLIKA